MRRDSPQLSRRAFLKAAPFVNTMWYCVVSTAPEKDFAVLIACNQGGDAAAGACDDAAGEAIRTVVS
jgi:hypothetical protein